MTKIDDDYLSIPYKNKKRFLKDFWGIVGPKKGPFVSVCLLSKKRIIVIITKLMT